MKHSVRSGSPYPPPPRRRRELPAGFGLLLAATACVSPAPAEAPVNERPEPPPSAVEAAVAPPAPAQVTELAVPDFLPAVLVRPGGSGPAPLLVAAHGAGGSPEWHCEYWRRLTRDRAFVLCLRGSRMGEGAYYFKNHLELNRELSAALGALRQAEPRVPMSGGVYAAFSQGASMGSLVLAEHAAQLPYAVLLEGFQEWNIPLGRKLARGGGKAVLFVCGTRACADKSRRSTHALKAAGVRARAEHAQGAGHTPLGGVRDLALEQLPWLLADDPLWEPVLDHATAESRD